MDFLFCINKITMKRHLISLFGLLLFLFIAAGSVVNKMSNFSFGRPTSEGVQNRVELHDGRVIETKKLDIRGGLFSSREVVTDSEDVPRKEVRGYLKGGIYYLFYKGKVLTRMVHGRINVYEEVYMTTTTQPVRNGFGVATTSTSNHTRYYYQYGDTGELNMLAGQKEIKEAVAGCEKAVELADLSNGQMRKAIRKNRNYLNEIFITYNEDCR